MLHTADSMTSQRPACEARSTATSKTLRPRLKSLRSHSAGETNSVPTRTRTGIPTLTEGAAANRTSTETEAAAPIEPARTGTPAHGSASRRQLAVWLRLIHDGPCHQSSPLSATRAVTEHPGSARSASATSTSQRGQGPLGARRRTPYGPLLRAAGRLNPIAGHPRGEPQSSRQTDRSCPEPRLGRSTGWLRPRTRPRDTPGGTGDLQTERARGKRRREPRGSRGYPTRRRPAPTRRPRAGCLTCPRSRWGTRIPPTRRGTLPRRQASP